MPKKSLEAIEEHFGKVTDPRVNRTQEHKLQEKTVKGGIHAKQLHAAWKQDYLLKVPAAAN